MFRIKCVEGQCGETLREELVALANQTLCLQLIELKFFCATLCVLLCMVQIEISKMGIAVDQLQPFRTVWGEKR